MFPIGLLAELPAGLHFALSVAAAVVAMGHYGANGDQDAFCEDVPPRMAHGVAYGLIAMAVVASPALIQRLDAPWWDTIARLQLLAAIGLLPLAADRNRAVGVLLAAGMAAWVVGVGWLAG